MKSDIKDYPEFYAAVKEDELVYFFGAGISSALTDNGSCGWWQWIYNGTDYFKNQDDAENLRESMKKDDSTWNLIRVAGEVLARTKMEGTYHTWMQASFEGALIKNKPLAETLRKMLIPQDIFATTNYDLLLEKATDIKTITYEEPQDAFAMLNHGKSDAVLHLHGVYDSATGKDNIVADQAQYDAVLNDKGAQFIQNILGTRTVIFIGCGQTSEDANISEFIRFAAEHLKMEKKYYFLYKTGQKLMDMPDNIIPIPYGDDYADLPLFLEDMVQLRLKNIITESPIIERTIYSNNKTDAYGLSEYHYANENLRFCGRKIELAQLEHFLETDRPFYWWAITGQGGAGKSRLAFELLHRCQNLWFGFFLNSAVSEESIAKFKPFNDTLIIIDYIKGNERRVEKVLAILMESFKSSRYKLRVLFLERDNLLLSGSWYHILVSNMDIAHRIEFNDAEFNADISTRNHRFMYLDDLDDEAVVELIGNVCELRGIPKDRTRDLQLKEQYARKFEQLKFRPLFLQIFVQAWIDNGCETVEYQVYTDLLEVVIKREQERILQALDNDPVAFNATIRLILRASIADGLQLSELQDALPNQWSILMNFVKTHSLSGKQRLEYLQTFLKDASQSLTDLDSVLKPMYPDIIKEYMFLYYLDVSDMREMSEELWRMCPENYNIFLTRCALDFQSNADLIEFIREESADGTNLGAMQVRWALLAYKVIHTNEEGQFFRKLAFDEYVYWTTVPMNEANKLIVMRGVYHCVWQFLGWSMPWRQCWEAIKRISEFEGDQELECTKIKYCHERYQKGVFWRLGFVRHHF